MSDDIYDDVIGTEFEKMIKDREEMTVVKYEIVHCVRGRAFRAEMKTPQPLQQTGSDSVMVRNYRAAVVCLVLLCVLLLTAVIVLCLTLIQERQQLISKNENLTNEREQLILKNTNLINEREQLKLKNTNLTDEREQLILKNTNLTNELRICVNWTRYQSSFYYMSKEKKNWTESRRYCTAKGADLIIINNREEQDFIHNMSGNGIFFIGLTDREVERTWKWVDNSTLTSGFWAQGEPNGDQQYDEDCVVTVAVPPPEWGNLVGWLDYECNKPFQWICEKRISQFILP